MSKSIQTTKRQLPKLDELHHSPVEAFKNDQFNLLLNQSPPETWLKKAPAFQGGGSYLPIDKVEYLLTKIFQEFKIEVIGYCQLFHSVTCHVRVHYKHPLTGEWSYHDGLGAIAVQVDKGSNASDLGSIKSNAVTLSLPSAKSYAIKDACDHLGALFGRDVNRKDTLEFQSSYGATEDQNWEELQELFELKGEVLSQEDAIAIDRIIKNKEKESFKKVKNLLKKL